MPEIFVVFGSNGFIGQNLVRRFDKEGIPVIGIQRKACCSEQVSMRKAEFIVDELRDLEGIRDVLGKYSDTKITLINAAAYGVNPSDRDQNLMFSVNVELPKKIVDLASEIGANVIQLGSSSEYAKNADGETLFEEAKPESEKQYGATKYCGHVLAALQAKHLSVNFMTLRLFNIYGPGEAEHRLLPHLIDRLANRQEASLSAGLQVRDFVFIDDVFEAIKIASKTLSTSNAPEPQAYNISTGTGSSVRDFAKTVCRLMDAEPELLKFGNQPLRPDDLPFVVGDNTAFFELTGWKPKNTIDDGIKKTIEHFAK